MQRPVSYRIPVGTKALAKLMLLTESEVRFFPKLNEMKEHIKSYNYNVLSKEELVEKINNIKSVCEEEKLDIYVGGLKELSQAIQYRY